MAEAAEAGSDGAAQEAKKFQWERLPDMPTERAYSVGGYHEGKLYVAGNDPCSCTYTHAISHVVNFITFLSNRRMQPRGQGYQRGRGVRIRQQDMAPAPQHAYM